MSANSFVRGDVRLVFAFQSAVPQLYRVVGHAAWNWGGGARFHVPGL